MEEVAAVALNEQPIEEDAGGAVVGGEEEAGDGQEDGENGHHPGVVEGGEAVQVEDVGGEEVRPGGHHRAEQP